MKKIRLGIIGCGGMSRFHVKAYTTQVADAEIVALCDPNAESLARYQRDFFDPIGQRPQAFADYQQLLDKAKPDAVLIVTPHTQHFEQVTASLDAGSHVFVEKPMVVTVEHARAVLNHAKKARRILSVAFPGNFSAEFQYIRGLLDKGNLGEVVAIDAFVAQTWKKGTAGTWRQDPALSGGGEVYDSGAHVFNAMLYLADARPAEVFAWMDNRGAPVDIIATASVRYTNGAIGTATINGDSVVTWDEGVRASFTRGEMQTGIHGNRLQQWDAVSKPVRYPPVPPVPCLQQQFIDCILGRAEDPSPAIWGLRQALLMEALYESARTGKAVKVGKE